MTDLLNADAGNTEETPPGDGEDTSAGEVSESMGEGGDLLNKNAPAPFNPETFAYPDTMEFSDEHKTFLAETAKKYAIPEGAMKALLGRYADEAKAASDRVSAQAETAWNEANEQWKAESVKHFGDKLDGALEKCAALIDEHGGDEVWDFLKMTGGGNNPAVLKMFTKLATALGEGKPILPNGAAPASNPHAAMYPSMVSKE